MSSFFPQPLTSVRLPHVFPRPLDLPLKVVYGSFPPPLSTFDDAFDEDFIAGFDIDRLRFLTLTYHHPSATFEIHTKHLIHGWLPPTVRHGCVITYRCPLVRILLCLATFVVHEPHGRLAEQFRKYHAYAAKTIFETLSNLPTRTSDTSSEVPIYPTLSKTYGCSIY